MGLRDVYLDVITKTESILVDKPTSNPKPSNNFKKTPSNINQKFKMINIWNEQIDIEIQSTDKGNGYIVKCPACLIEFDPGEGKLIGGGVTQYMDARIYFHIYSNQLNTPNIDGGDNMDRNLEIFDLRDSLKSVFNGFHTHNSSYMMSCVDKPDYKHQTLTAYILGFTFCWNDEKGSILDPKSSRYQVYGDKTGGTTQVVAKHDWISGNSYVALVNCVYFAGISGGAIVGTYLCITSNSDAVFTPAKWQILTIWYANTAYQINSYIFINDFAYKCNTPNSDTIFDPNKWDLITHI